MTEIAPTKKFRTEIMINDLPIVLKVWAETLVEKGFECRAFLDKEWGCHFLDFGDFYIFIKVEGSNLIIKNVFSVNKGDSFFTNAFEIDLLQAARQQGITKIVAANVSTTGAKPAYNYWKNKLKMKEINKTATGAVDMVLDLV